MPDFVVEGLTDDRIALAFPLIRHVAPHLDLRRWTSFARRVVRARSDPPRNGILVVRREARPHPCGLVCFRREDDLTLGSVLTAEYYVAMDLLDPAGAVEALVAELEATARRMGCGAIRSLLTGPAKSVATRLLAADHRHGGSQLVKLLVTLG